MVALQATKQSSPLPSAYIILHLLSICTGLENRRSPFKIKKERNLL